MNMASRLQGTCRSWFQSGPLCIENQTRSALQLGVTVSEVFAPSVLGRPLFTPCFNTEQWLPARHNQAASPSFARKPGVYVSTK